MKEPFVTVAIPCYNAEAYLGAAVTSILVQTISNWEIVIVDDRSTDSSWALAKDLAGRDERIRTHQVEVNGGPATARNAAFALARGRWIAVLDSDDLMHPDRLRQLIHKGEEDQADLIADDLLLFRGEGEETRRFLSRRRKGSYSLSLAEYLQQTRMHGGTPDLGFLKPLFRRSFLERHRLRYDERLRVGEDDDLVVRALLAGARYSIVTSPTYFYRRHETSISHSHHRELPLIIKCSNELAPVARSHGREVTRLFNERTRARLRAHHYGELIRHLKKRDFFGALKAISRRPLPLSLLRLPVQARVQRVWQKLRRSVTAPENVPLLTTSSSRPTVWFVDRPSAANLIGLGWFVEAVWPEVLKKIPDARLLVPATAPGMILQSDPRHIEPHQLSPSECLSLVEQAVVFPVLVTGGEPPFLIDALAATNRVVTTDLAQLGPGLSLSSCRKPLDSPSFAQEVTAALEAVRSQGTLRMEAEGGTSSHASVCRSMVRLMEIQRQMTS